jgi:alkylation response protein AidB-like acyl-CoA dehydrogenase
MTHSLLLPQYLPKLAIGEVGDAPPAPEKPEKVMEIAQRKPSALFSLPPSELAFGEQVPFGDPIWYQDWNSPYYNDSHRKLRAAAREFVDKEIMPYCAEWDEKKVVPREFYRRCYEVGILPGVLGNEWPTEYVGDHVCGGIKPEEWDVFHVMILIDELSRCGSGGVALGIFGGLGIGLPPVFHFGSEALKKKVVGPCIRGEKFICLAITEPYAGSDVANIKCEARKTPDGLHYIVNGEKKWITNGIFSDYFTVAVRTGEAGMKGISLLLIERERAGVSCRQMNCSGLWPSGTTYITFEDVKVPVSNLIGKENQGFRYIMANFSPERWGIAVQATRFARVCLEESIKYAHKRKTFGKRLIDQPVIRAKIASMAHKVEAAWAWIEFITYQLKTVRYYDKSMHGA